MRRKFLSRRSFSAISFAVFASLGARAALGQTNSTWTDTGGDSNWGTATNWSPSGAPNGDFNVVIGAPSPTNVNGAFSIDSMTVNGAGLVDVLNNESLTLTGPTLTDNGTITINPTSGGNTTVLALNGVTVSGTGKIVLNASANTAELTGTIDQLPGHTISGFGELQAALTNNGIVNANVAATLFLQSNSMTNNGLMEATSGGTLQVNQIEVIQGAGGQLSAGLASAVNFNNSTVSGGTLFSSGSGVFQTLSSTSSTIDNLINNAAVNIANNSTLNATGTIANNGVITVNTTSGGNNTLLQFNGTLSGTGAVVLNSSGALAELNGTLTQSAGSTVRGFGEIGAALTNNGTVNANVASTSIILLSNTMTNNSLMQATSGGTLQINPILVVQGSSGQISAGSASFVTFNGSTLVGGTLVSSSTGQFQTIATTNSTLTNLTNDAAVNVVNNSQLTVSGNLVDNGTITVNSNQGGNTTSLDFIGGTLSGTGAVVLNNTSSLAELTGTLTQASTHTIKGFGEFLGASFTNQGTVASGGGRLDFSGSTVTNTSVMKATSGTLQFDGGTSVNNAGGMIITAGGNVNLLNMSLSGGTLTSSSGNVISADGANFNNNITITAGSQVNVDNNNQLLVNSPTLTNNGTITINPLAQGNTTDILFNGNDLLAGSGAIVLNSATNAAHVDTNGTLSFLTQAAGHTIRGFGQVNAALINNGTVNASVAGQTLNLGANNMTNNALFEATGGSSALSINSITVTQGPGGTILATGVNTTASVVNVVASAITGGTLATQTAGLIQITGSAISAFNNATIAAGSSVNVLNNNTLNIGGNLVNNGTLTINSQDQGNITNVNFITGGTLSGTGTVVLNSATGAAQINGTVFVAAGQTVLGQGEFQQGILTNNGLINANSLVAGMNIDENVTNNATMEATGGATLQFNGITVTQGSGAQLVAASASFVNLSTATIIGGTLNGAGTFQAVTGTNNFFTNVTNNAKINILNNSDIQVTGNLVNNSTITVNKEGEGNNTFLEFLGTNSTLSGTGTVVLNSSGGAAEIVGTVDVAAGQIVQGLGQFQQGVLTNNGLINANVPGNGINVNENVTNNTTMEATNGSILAINGITVTQGSGGQLVAASASFVNLSTATIIGGTLNGAGTFQAVTGTNNFFTNVTNNAKINILNNSDIQVTGNLVNNSTITVNKEGEGNNTFLEFLGTNSTLSGTGTVVLNSSGGAAEIVGTVDVAAGQIVQGLGQFQQGVLTNNGLINANVPGNGINVNENVTNNTTMEATNGSILAINGTTVTQGSGGQILAASASFVNLSSGTITGGALNGAGTFQVVTGTNNVLNNVTNNATVNIVNNAAIFIGGNLVNNGTLTINPSGQGNVTFLDFTTNGATLSGTGTVVLSSPNAQAEIIGSLAVTQTSTGTIRGVGDITVSLTNNGTVNANVNLGVLNLQGNNMTNNGLFEATGGGQLSLNGITVTQGGGGLITASSSITGTPSYVVVNSSAITGGLVATGLGGILDFVGNTDSVPGSITNSGTVEGNSSLATVGQIAGTGAITVGSNDELKISGINAASTATSVSINNGTLDITNNKLVINFGSPAADPVAGIAAALRTGYNGGNWLGRGIASSTAAANQSKFAIGYLDGNVAVDTTAKTVATNQILIQYTLAGDAFLENEVGFDDLVIVAQDFGKTGEDWAGGNFNYDPTGLVGFADLVSVAQNFGFTTGFNEGSAAGGVSLAWQVAGATIQSTVQTPEPASFALAVVAAGGLLSRRRRASRAKDAQA